MSTSQDFMKIPKNLLVTIVTKNSQKNSLLLHKTTIHEGIKPYKCDYCEKSFGSSFNLDRHNKNTLKTESIQLSIDGPQLSKALLGKTVKENKK